MKIAYWIVTGFFCLMMFVATAIEIFQFGESVKMLGELGYPAHIAPLEFSLRAANQFR